MKFDGYDDEEKGEFSVNVRKVGDFKCKTIVRGLIIDISEEILSRVTVFPMGMIWDKEDRELALKDNNTFFRSY